MELEQSVDIEELADKARLLWSNASVRVTTARVELFVKVAVRRRVTRELARTGTTLDRGNEAGLAVRALRAGHDAAGFAASSGLSVDAARWAVDTACSYRALASAAAPGPADRVASTRWDVDAPIPLPTDEALTAALMARPHVQWVEAGTTVEVLIGADGWLAGRRRHRLWARSDERNAQMVAQRGFTAWEEMLDRIGDVDPSPIRSAAAAGVVILDPEAAAPVVSALAATFHGVESQNWGRGGVGWELADQPAHPKGLAGGEFDDAGFPAVTRVLSRDGVWVANLGGPGTFRRNSFREPPTESPTNLVVPGDLDTGPYPGLPVHASRCRVLRMSPDLWVLEMGFAAEAESSRDRWVRVHPLRLLEGCVARLGPNRVTPDGPIVPALVFEGL